MKGIEGAFIALHKILLEDLNNPISFIDIIKIRKKYIIVFNEVKNTRTGYIRSHLSAKKVKFGLNRYENTFFEEIMTITKKSYNTNIHNIMNSNSGS